ncbi:heterokaryon incompatibility protein-domain-containing protein [Xylariaceae sp. FL1272]|nr:heterokaryon incompatibility protein-domain-containing protein [Xylariaceae sp. FL1272]
MMKTIYKTSERTVIWLGPNIAAIEAVEPLLGQLSQLYNQDLDPRGPRKRQRYTVQDYITLDLPDHQDLSWSILGDILSRPWFVRSWVVQEAALSRVTPLVLCGTHLLPWDSILSSATWVLSMCYNLTPLSRRPTTVAALRSFKLFSELRQVGLPWDLTTLLNKARRSKSSEPRDRIYSLISLSGEADKNCVLPPALRANYNKPIRTIFRDITRYIIISTGKLSILTLIRDYQDWNRYPSWVVDFSGGTRWERISYFSWSPHPKGWHCVDEISNHTAGGMPVEVQHSPDDILALKGFRVDTISTVCEIMSTSAPDRLGTQALGTWIEACHRLKARYATVEARTRALMVTMSADWNLTAQTRVADQSTSHFTAFMRDAYSRMNNEEAQTRYGAESYIGVLANTNADVTADPHVHRLHLDAAHNRRIIFTDQSFVGLGPSIVEKSDIVCVLFGGATPMILRP